MSVKAHLTLDVPSPHVWGNLTPIAIPQLGCWMRLRDCGYPRFTIDTHPWLSEAPHIASPSWAPLDETHVFVGLMNKRECIGWIKGALYAAEWLREFAPEHRAIPKPP